MLRIELHVMEFCPSIRVRGGQFADVFSPLIC